MEAYFDNLLPDSDAIRKRIAHRFGVRNGTFDLLAQVGRDCVGAVQLLPPDSIPPDVRTIHATPLTSAQIESRIDRTLAGEAFGAADNEDELRISLAGAQEKTALLWHNGRWCEPSGATPTTHILKLPMGKVGQVQADFSTSVENEWLCAKILAAYQLPVAECSIEHFGRHKVLSVTRFDRALQPGGWLARLPQEDFCQVYGLPPSSKYQNHGGPGIDSILQTLRGSIDAENDRRNFLKAQLVFWLLAAPDGHAKNFSLHLEAGGSFRMTKLYDVMSAWPIIGNGPNLFSRKKLKLAMSVNGVNFHYKIDDIRRRHWNATAKRNGMGLDFESEIQAIVGETPRVIHEIRELLPPGFPEAVSQPILAGLREQAHRLGLEKCA